MKISLKQIYKEASGSEEILPALHTVLNDGAFSKASKALLVGKGLYRFTAKNRGPYYTVGPRKTERTPVDTLPSVDKKLEEVRKKSYPKMPNRQKSVFCYPFDPKHLGGSTLKMESGVYGNYPYMIVPRNGFKLFQSSKVGDFTTSVAHNSIVQFLEDEKKLEPGHSKLDDSEYAMLEAIADYFKGTTDINRVLAFSVSHEVVIEHMGYWAFNLKRLRALIKGTLGMNGLQFFEAAKDGSIL